MKEETKENRRQVGFAEKTIAALVSKAQTRVFIHDRPHAEGADGAYSPDNDTIVLYPSLSNPTAVALEEAGHSLMRPEYLKHQVEWKRIVEELEKTGARHVLWLLNWLEDARVDTLIRRKYPGTAEIIREKWEERRAEVSKLFKVVGSEDEASAWVGVMTAIKQVVDDFLAGKAPKSFQEVLKRITEFLRATPPTLPAPIRGSFFIDLTGPLPEKSESGKAESPKPSKSKAGTPKSPEEHKDGDEVGDDEVGDKPDAGDKPDPEKEVSVKEEYYVKVEAKADLPISGTIILIIDGIGLLGSPGAYLGDTSLHGWQMLRRDVIEDRK